MEGKSDSQREREVHLYDKVYDYSLTVRARQWYLFRSDQIGLDWKSQRNS